jgi:hypothetical protein
LTIGRDSAILFGLFYLIMTGQGILTLQGKPLFYEKPADAEAVGKNGNEIVSIDKTLYMDLETHE